MELKFCEPESKDGRVCVSPPKNIVHKVDPRWNERLVGYFIEQCGYQD